MAAAPQLPLDQAALQLGVAPVTLRRWIAQGAPVARAGQRGRGRRALVDPVAIAAWRAAPAAVEGPIAPTLTFKRAEALIAGACAEVYSLAAAAPRDFGAAEVIAALGYRIVVAIAEELGAPEPALHPDFSRLRAIGRRA